MEISRDSRVEYVTSPTFSWSRGCLVPAALRALLCSSRFSLIKNCNLLYANSLRASFACPCGRSFVASSAFAACVQLCVAFGAYSFSTNFRSVWRAFRLHVSTRLPLAMWATTSSWFPRSWSRLSLLCFLFIIIYIRWAVLIFTMFIIMDMNGILFTFDALVIVTLSFIFVVFRIWCFGLLSWLILWLLPTLWLLLGGVCHLSNVLGLAGAWVLLLLNAGDFLGSAVSVVASLVVALVVEFVTSLAFAVSQNGHASGAHLALSNVPWALGVRSLRSPLLLDWVLILELILSSGILFVIILGLGYCSRVRTTAIFILTSSRRWLSAWISVRTWSHWPTSGLSLSTTRRLTLDFPLRFVFL